MGHAFELPAEATVAATPAQVWAAIATGPGIDSWFLGRTEIAGGDVRTTFGGLLPETRVTAMEPPHRFAHATGTGEDGRLIAYEYLVEGRGGGSTVVRAVTSGFLPGDDWAAEYEAMTYGTQLFFHTLVEYLNHFAGRTATPVTAFGPAIADWDEAWAVLHRALGLAGPPRFGDTVRIEVAGLAPIDGVVYFTNPHTLGVRAEGALYRFLRGLGGPLIAAHHLFDDSADTTGAWERWLATNWSTP